MGIKENIDGGDNDNPFAGWRWESDWYLYTWNGDDWNREGPYNETEGRKKYRAHCQVMPNCPAMLCREQVIEMTPGNQGPKFSGFERLAREPR